MKQFDALCTRCQRSAAGIEALPRLAALLEGGAECKATKVDNRNRWLADCKLPEGRNLAREMIFERFACATKNGTEFRALELEARKSNRGLWSHEWADKLTDFPSSLCIVSNRHFKRHLQYIKSKHATKSVHAQEREAQ